MEKTKFNYAFVFSIMVLLVFSYITFLGLVYWKAGEIVLPILLTLALIAIIIGCVYVMCLSKATRWKRIGTIGQVFFGLIVLVTLIAAAYPFTNYLRVLADSEEIAQKVEATCDAAEKLDVAYEEYVNERVENYRSNLALIGKGKSINPTRYKECLGGASGATDEAKIAALSKSLNNKLYPDSTAEVVMERHELLNSARNANVLNPLMPSNIKKIGEQVGDWVNNYKELSSISYKGEDAASFTYEDFDNQLSQLTETYTKFHRPSFFSIVISLICFVIMMLPYWVTDGTLAGKISKRESRKTSKTDNDKPYE